MKKKEVKTMSSNILVEKRYKLFVKFVLFTDYLDIKRMVRQANLQIVHEFIQHIHKFE